MYIHIRHVYIRIYICIHICKIHICKTCLLAHQGSYNSQLCTYAYTPYVYMYTYTPYVYTYIHVYIRIHIYRIHICKLFFTTFCQGSYYGAIPAGKGCIKTYIYIHTYTPYTCIHIYIYMYIYIHLYRIHNFKLSFKTFCQGSYYGAIPAGRGDSGVNTFGNSGSMVIKYICIYAYAWVYMYI